MTPNSVASGKLRVGFFSSAPSSVRFPQPLKPQSAPITAAPKPAKPKRALAGTSLQEAAAPLSPKCSKPPSVNANAPTATAATSATLIAVSALASPPLLRTEARLSAVERAIAASGTNDRASGGRAPPSRSFAKIANATASAACDPDLPTRICIQPYRNAVARPYAARRK